MPRLTHTKGAMIEERGQLWGNSGGGAMVREQWGRNNGGGALVEEQWWESSGGEAMVGEQWCGSSGGRAVVGSSGAERWMRRDRIVSVTPLGSLLGVGSTEQGEGDREEEAGSREQEARSREEEAGSRDQEARSREEGEGRGSRERSRIHTAAIELISSELTVWQAVV